MVPNIRVLIALFESREMKDTLDNGEESRAEDEYSYYKFHPLPGSSATETLLVSKILIQSFISN